MAIKSFNVGVDEPKSHSRVTLSPLVPSIEGEAESFCALHTEKTINRKSTADRDMNKSSMWYQNRTTPLLLPS